MKLLNAYMYLPCDSVLCVLQTGLEKLHLWYCIKLKIKKNIFKSLTVVTKKHNSDTYNKKTETLLSFYCMYHCCFFFPREP